MRWGSHGGTLLLTWVVPLSLMGPLEPEGKPEVTCDHAHCAEVSARTPAYPSYHAIVNTYLVIPTPTTNARRFLPSLRDILACSIDTVVEAKKAAPVVS